MTAPFQTINNVQRSYDFDWTLSLASRRGVGLREIDGDMIFYCDECHRPYHFVEAKAFGAKDHFAVITNLAMCIDKSIILASATYIKHERKDYTLSKPILIKELVNNGNSVNLDGYMATWDDFLKRNIDLLNTHRAASHPSIPALGFSHKSFPISFNPLIP